MRLLYIHWFFRHSTNLMRLQHITLRSLRKLTKQVQEYRQSHDDERLCIKRTVEEYDETLGHYTEIDNAPINVICPTISLYTGCGV